MFTLFQSKEKEMETLDEKQIQERLYGRYHRGSAGSSVATTTPKQQTVSVAVEKPVKQAVTPQAYHEVSGGVLGAIVELLRHVPWKFIGVLAGAFVMTLLLVNLIAYLFGKMKDDLGNEGKSNHPHAIQVEKISSSRETIGNQIVPLQKIKMPEGVSSSSNSNLGKMVVAVPASNLNQISGAGNSSDIEKTSTSKQKFYAVQICTYQREADAKTLVAALNRKGFKSFVREMPSQQKDFYVVFLERSKSYTNAKNMLSKFKASDLSPQFEDAFIRSI